MAIWLLTLGTLRIVLDNGVGEWEGTHTGFTRGWFGPLEVQAVACGSEGQVDGMQLRMVASYETWPLDPTTGRFGLETDTGYRFDPGNK